jgi:hypothetical protein
MASAVRQMTGVGGDIRKIARLLQKEAPPGHMLAYINQEEADLLKARGGSGEPHADTGVPSFQTQAELDSYDQYYTGAPAESYERGAYLPEYDVGAYQESDRVPIQTSESSFVAPGAQPDFTQIRPSPVVTANFPDIAAATAALAPGSAEGRVPYIPTPRETGNYPGGSVLTGQKDVGAEPDFFERMSDKTKAKLGIGGIQSILAAYQISQSTEQAKKYREDMARLAQPYQAEGKKLIAQAQSGQLTPAAQQQLQAAQAQAAQGAERRGGVGAQQAMMAVEGMRQQLLQNQYDYGLKVSGIGDQIATGAIRAGMQADQYVNSLASNYANNIARLLAGTPTYVYQQTQPVE